MNRHSAGIFTGGMDFFGRGVHSLGWLLFSFLIVTGCESKQEEAKPSPTAPPAIESEQIQDDRCTETHTRCRDIRNLESCRNGKWEPQTTCGLYQPCFMQDGKLAQCTELDFTTVSDLRFSPGSKELQNRTSFFNELQQDPYCRLLRSAIQTTARPLADVQALAVPESEQKRVAFCTLSWIADQVRTLVNEHPEDWPGLEESELTFSEEAEALRIEWRYVNAEQSGILPSSDLKIAIATTSNLQVPKPPDVWIAAEEIGLYFSIHLNTRGPSWRQARKLLDKLKRDLEKGLSLFYLTSRFVNPPEVFHNSKVQRQLKSVLPKKSGLSNFRCNAECERALTALAPRLQSWKRKDRAEIEWHLSKEEQRLLEQAAPAWVQLAILETLSFDGRQTPALAPGWRLGPDRVIQLLNHSLSSSDYANTLFALLTKLPNVNPGYWTGFRFAEAESLRKLAKPLLKNPGSKLASRFLPIWVKHDQRAAATMLRKALRRSKKRSDKLLLLEWIATLGGEENAAYCMKQLTSGLAGSKSLRLLVQRDPAFWDKALVQLSNWLPRLNPEGQAALLEELLRLNWERIKQTEKLTPLLKKLQKNTRHFGVYANTTHLLGLYASPAWIWPERPKEVDAFLLGPRGPQEEELLAQAVKNLAKLDRLNTLSLFRYAQELPPFRANRLARLLGQLAIRSKIVKKESRRVARLTETAEIAAFAKRVLKLGKKR